MQASEVAKARLEQAKSSIASKTATMDRLDLGTKHLKLFFNLGLSVSTINSTARAVGLVISEIFTVWLYLLCDRMHTLITEQRVEGIPKTYKDLRGIVADLVKELDSICKAGKSFSTELVRLSLKRIFALSRAFWFVDGTSL